MKKLRPWLFLLLIALIIAAAVLYYYTAVRLPAQAQTEPVLQTARVRQGDLVISVFGVGELAPQAQASAAFRSGGVVAEVFAAEGERVKAGQLLARLEDDNAQQQLAQSQLALQDLFSPSALLQAQVAALSAEVSYEKTLGDLQTLISPAVWQAEQDLELAQATLASTPSTDALAQAAAQDALVQAEANLAQAQADYESDYLPAIFTKPYIDPSSGVTLRGVFPPSAAEIALARVKLESARLSLEDARAYAELIAQGVPCDQAGLLTREVTLPARLDQACLSVRNANLALENTRLLAPLSGMLTNFNLAAGQPVGSAALATVATLDQLKLKVYVDEVDLSALQTGQQVVITFNAHPNQAFAGRVQAIEPALQNVGGALTAVAWVELENEPGILLISGMTAEVEVIAGEARSALLVPVQALRELAPGSFSVFIVQPDGQLKLTPVTVGLRDFANAQILGGLEAGDIVSTGAVETK